MRDSFRLTISRAKIPFQVIEVGEFMHTCEDDIVCKTTCGKIPFFNAPIYFKSKEQIGKIDEIFGSLLDNVSVNPA